MTGIDIPICANQIEISTQYLVINNWDTRGCPICLIICTDYNSKYKRNTIFASKPIFLTLNFYNNEMVILLELIILNKYNPELAQKLHLLPAYDFDNIILTRKKMAGLYEKTTSRKLRQLVSISDTFIPSESNPGRVQLRVYQPSDHETFHSPALVYLHGGGFAFAPPDSLLDKVCAHICVRLHIVVIAVKYSLAPENPFPAALLDCYSALAWISCTRNLRIDTSRIAIYGSSAGATLAAGLSLLVRDRKGPEIRFQFLETPALDDRLQTNSIAKIEKAPLLNKETLRQVWAHYLTEPAVIDGHDGLQYAAPARASDLNSIPPTYIMVCDIDPLRDEAIHYATRLMQGGIPTELHTYPGTFHGCIIFSETRIAQQMIADRDNALRSALIEVE